MKSNARVGRGTTKKITVISFHVFFTPIEILERLSSVGVTICESLFEIQNQLPDLEVVPVQTCNRFEFYFRTTQGEKASRAILTTLARQTGLAQQTLKTCSRMLSDRDAVQYLFESVSGLQSIALGEHQILGQIRAAYLHAREQGLARNALAALFETALHVGKRVRNETRLGLRQFSLSKMALQGVVKRFANRKSLQIVLIGTGKMARAAAEYLLAEGIENFCFFSRHPEERRFLVEAYGKPVLHFNELAAHAAAADILFSAYGTNELILDRSFFERTMPGRNRPLVVIDIAMPRDVEPDVASLDFVQFTDFQSLYNSRWRTEMAADPEVQRAKELINEESLRYERLEKQREIAGTIRRLHSRFGDIARSELDRTLKGLPHLSARDQKKIEKMVHNITQKILHHPTTLLRDHVCRDDAISYLRFVEEMVNLKTRNELETGERADIENA